MGAIGDRMRLMASEVELVVPWDRGDVLAGVHREGQVLDSVATEEGMRVRARMEPASVGALRRYLVDGSDDA